MSRDSLPLEAIWLDAEAVGAMLCYKPRIVRERLAMLPDFPKPMRVDGIGQPRWNAAEITAWAKAQREKTDGRRAA